MAPVLDIQDLSTHIKLTSSVVQAVGNVDLHIEAGETLGVVGESGCGKSMTGLSIMGLLPPGGSIVGGSIKLNGRELVGLKDEALRQVRGNEIAMIFQDPLTSLDPTKTIGYQVAEPVRLHKNASKAEALDRAVEVLALVGLPRPKERLSDYPHQLSGGLRQRVMIGMALANEPKLLIADEPTTALDVTIQAQILALLRDLKDRLGMAMLLITHDMGVIAGHADRVNVMYAGRVVETAEVNNLFNEMHHPYTQALLASIPQLDQDARKALHAIPGLPPDLAHPPQGCRFAARCSRATDKCRADEPSLSGKTFDHRFSCWHPVEGPLVLAVIGAAGPDAESTGLVAPDAESMRQAAAGDEIGYVADAPLPGAGAAEADNTQQTVPGMAEPVASGQPVAVAAGLELTPDGRLEVAERAVEAAAVNGDGAAPLLEISKLVKEYPVTSGLILQRKVAAVQAVSNVSFAVLGRHHVRLGRRIGVRQDHDRQDDRRAGAAQLRRGHAGRRGRFQAAAAASCGASAATCSSCSRIRTPRSTRGCGSARSSASRSRCSTSAASERSGTASTNCSARSGCRGTRSSGTRTSSPAASGSGSAWPGRSP